jgi:hypothetical protein
MGISNPTDYRIPPSRLELIRKWHELATTDLGQTGEHGVVTEDDHGVASRKSNDRRASAKISSADWSGHTPCLLSMA